MIIFFFLFISLLILHLYCYQCCRCFFITCLQYLALGFCFLLFCLSSCILFFAILVAIFRGRVWNLGSVLLRSLAVLPSSSFLFFSCELPSSHPLLLSPISLKHEYSSRCTEDSSNQLFQLASQLLLKVIRPLQNSYFKDTLEPDQPSLLHF